jgi:hypothetical protein
MPGAEAFEDARTKEYTEKIVRKYMPTVEEAYAVVI